MAGEYIFTMQDLIKRYGRNDVLNGINLSFITEPRLASLAKTDRVNPPSLKSWRVKIKSLRAAPRP